MIQVDVNPLAVVLAALSSMVLGSLWYSPLLFAQKWMKLVGKSKEDLTGAKMGYIVSTVASLVMAYILGVFIKLLGISTALEGAIVGLWVWLGFVATTYGVNTVFESRPKELYLINNGYHLITLVVMGTILAYL